MNRPAHIKLVSPVLAITLAGIIGYLVGAHAVNITPSAGNSTVDATPVPGSVHVFYSLDKKHNDAELISLINHAKQYVHFAIYEFTLQDVADALVRAKERGVDVRGIVDRENSTTPYEAPIIATLRAANIPVETQVHRSGIMHIKALVTENAYASGSYNWTNSATTKNDEVLEIGTDPELRTRYEAILKQLLATNNAGALPTTVHLTSAIKNTSTSPSGTYNYTDASKYIGQTASVHGIVVNVYTAKSGTTFFDYCTNYKNCPFSAVIFAKDKSKFDSLTRYQGRSITITGPITSYKNHAKMVIHDPNQIKIQ